MRNLFDFDKRLQNNLAPAVQLRHESVVPGVSRRCRYETDCGYFQAGACLSRNTELCPQHVPKRNRRTHTAVSSAREQAPFVPGEYNARSRYAYSSAGGT